MPSLTSDISNRSHQFARLRCIVSSSFVAGLFLCSSTTAPAAAQTSLNNDIWAETRVAGGQAGYYHEAATNQNGQIITLIENDVVLNRMGSKVEIKSTSRYVESEDGHLLGVSNEMSSSAQSTKTDAIVTGQSLLIHTSTGGKTYDRTLPFTSDLLGPAGARQLHVSRLRTIGDTVSYQTFYPELGSVTSATDTLRAIEQITVMGEQKQALKLEQTNSAMPGKVDLWVDRDGWLLRQVFPSPFGEMESVRTTAENLRPTEIKGAALPQESFKNTLVISNVRLPEERLIEQLTIRITHRKPELGWPDFTADNQKVLEQTPDHVVLQIRRVLPKEDGQRPLATPSTDLLAFLQPNALLQSDDAGVQSIAEKVVGNDANAFRAARNLQEWTNENMKFDLGIAIAPASEVARNHRGTCFGYAVLLASLARVEGIPSRVRMGFVYAGGIWGGHAWVEVFTGENWVPLDGALYTPGPADAARFSFFTSGLQEGTVAKVGELAKLYGNVDIRVVNYTIHNKRVDVPADAKPFSISEDTYLNPWLGLSLRKPKSFRFMQLYSVWPVSTILAMEGPEKQLVEIQSFSQSLPLDEKTAEKEFLADDGITGTAIEKIVDGHRGTFIESADLAGLAFREGGNAFVVTAKGHKATQLLMQVLSTMELQD